MLHQERLEQERHLGLPGANRTPAILWFFLWVPERAATLMDLAHVLLPCFVLLSKLARDFQGLVGASGSQRGAVGAFPHSVSFVRVSGLGLGRPWFPTDPFRKRLILHHVLREFVDRALVFKTGAHGPLEIEDKDRPQIMGPMDSCMLPFDAQLSRMPIPPWQVPLALGPLGGWLTGKMRT